MRRLAAPLLLLLLLSLPGAAAARVPHPNPMPAVSDQSCPGLTEGIACFQPDTFTVYLTPYDAPETEEHEFGHAFDQQRLDDGERHRFASLIRMNANPWVQPNLTDTQAMHMTPGELFADAYADCRLGHGQRRICGFISRASDLDYQSAELNPTR